MPADNKGANPIHEKKDDPGQEKGDKGHAADEKREKQEEHGDSHQPMHQSRGGHRKRLSGNPDGSN